MYNSTPYRIAERTNATASLSYLRRVYSYFAGGVGFAIAGAMVALYAGSPVVVTRGYDGVLAIPPVVAFAMEHSIVMLLVFFGSFFAASFARRKPGLNIAALLGYTFITGIFVAPALFVAQVSATHGATLDPSPVRDAFLLTGAAFTGLTSYVFVSKRDFSYLGAALSMGLWVVIGASILGMFIGSSAFQLAIASVGVLLFGGYILYDTSRILNTDDETDPIGAALKLFLDVVNLFLSLLRILSATSRDR